MTRSPGSQPVTPGPSSATVPATSSPRIAESPGGGGYFPSRCTRSGRLMLVATVLTSTWPSAGRGRSASPSVRTSRPPKPLSRTAFMGALLREGRGAPCCHERGRRRDGEALRPARPAAGGPAPGSSRRRAKPPPWARMRAGAWLLGVAAAALSSCGHGGDPRRSDVLARERDELSALWSLYRYTHVQAGRVVAHDEGGITTSEGQAYAMLRAVWTSDRETFDAVWRWT